MFKFVPHSWKKITHYKGKIAMTSIFRRELKLFKFSDSISVFFYYQIVSN